MINKAQRRLLAIAGGLVKKAFPDTAGNVRFNLFPNREKVNTNVDFSLSLILDVEYDDKIEIEAEV